MNISRFIPRALLLAVIVGAVFWAAVYRDQIGATSLDHWLTGLGLWAPVVALWPLSAWYRCFLLT
jgi:hypothetical protein